MVSGTCKHERGAEQLKVIKTCIEANTGDQPHICVVCVSSDGETKCGSTLVMLTFKHQLHPDSPIYALLKPCHLLDLHIRDDELTADKDYCHVLKHLCNGLLWQSGLTLKGSQLTPDKIQQYLKMFQTCSWSFYSIRKTFKMLNVLTICWKRSGALVQYLKGLCHCLLEHMMCFRHLEKSFDTFSILISVLTLISLTSLNTWVLLLTCVLFYTLNMAKTSFPSHLSLI